MERVMSATDARVHFGEVLKAVAEQGDSVIVERTGQPLAVVIPIAEYRRIRSRDELAGRWERWRVAHEQLRAFYDEERAAGRLRDLDFDVVEDLRHSREERDEQLLRNTLPGR